MKPQDIVFLVIFAALFFIGKPRLTQGVGIASLLIAIPLFAFWIFFTAERLTWYAASFFLLAIGQYYFIMRKKNT